MVYIRAVRWVVGWGLLAALAGAGCSSSAGAPGGAADGGAGDAGLPSARELLPSERYDCRAGGPFAAPARPHPPSCFRDRACDARLVSAHRMGTPYGPENSLAAIRASILLGVDILETDLRLTADGHIVLLHDREVDRTAEGTGNVDALTLAEVKALPLRLGSHLAGGDFGCERIPTLEEALEVSRGQTVLELEVKQLEAGIAAARLLAERGLYADAFLLCDVDECRAVRAVVPDVPIMPRASAPDEVPAALDFDPPPIMVHIDPFDSFLVPAVLDPIRAAGAKVFVNGIVQSDPQAAFGGDLSGYLALWDAGIDVILVENPQWALLALDRIARP